MLKPFPFLFFSFFLTCNTQGYWNWPREWGQWHSVIHIWATFLRGNLFEKTLPALKTFLIVSSCDESLFSDCHLQTDLQCANVWDVQFILVCRTVRGRDGNLDRAKNGSHEGRKMFAFFFFKTLCKHIRTRIKWALLERNKDKKCEVFPWRWGSWGSTGARQLKLWMNSPAWNCTAHFSLFLCHHSHSGAGCAAESLLQYVCPCLCDTLIYCLVVRNEKEPSFWSKLAWPLTTRNVGKYTSIGTPALYSAGPGDLMK